MIGKSFWHYAIIEKLGQDGMEEAFLAQDSSLDRRAVDAVQPWLGARYSWPATPAILGLQVRFPQQGLESVAAVRWPFVEGCFTETQCV
ncbi:MAG: hypothetical protein ABSH28_21790 [Acidobacteriota bacterium]|jgi:hypothetical protein